LTDFTLLLPRYARYDNYSDEIAALPSVARNDKSCQIAMLHTVACNPAVSQFKNMKKFDKNFPFKAIIKMNKHFRYSFLGRMFCLFPILNLAINCDTA